MSVYVISGVAGMTGSELARELTKKAHYVIGFDNFFASSRDNIAGVLENELFSFFEYDLTNTRQMNDLKTTLMQPKYTQGPLIYINCAAIVHTEHFYYISRTFETNVVGMRQLLEQAIEMGAETYINCSTSEVYSMASWKEGGVEEKDFLTMAHAEHSQRTSYATGKLLTEFFMREAVEEKRIKGCSIRFANVYSKNERYSKHIIPHILHQLKNNGRVELLENSKVNRRSFLHNKDSCSAVMALAETEDALDGSVYNVATDEEISIVELVYLCAGKMGIQNATITFSGWRESDPERRLLSIDKIKHRTGWSPQVSLDEGIDMCLKEMGF